MLSKRAGLLFQLNQLQLKIYRTCLQFAFNIVARARIERVIKRIDLFFDFHHRLNNPLQPLIMSVDHLWKSFCLVEL